MKRVLAAAFVFVAMGAPAIPALLLLGRRHARVQVIRNVSADKELAEAAGVMQRQAATRLEERLLRTQLAPSDEGRPM